MRPVMPATPHFAKSAVQYARVMVLVLLSVVALENRLGAQGAATTWNSAGQDSANTRSQFQESGIGPSNVSNLYAKWTFTTGGNVSATPTVSGNTVYFPDLKGTLYAVNKQNGLLVWSHKISDYTGVTGAITRVSPAIDGTHLFIGDKLGSSTVRVGADLISINNATGALEWITQVESHPAAIITGSPVVYDGIVYIGVSSNEEGFAEQASYACCTFRGSIVAVDETTGKVLWKTYTVPDNGGKPGGYSGASIWSPPAIDTVRKTVYVGTANNYTAPSDVEACENANPTQNCAAPDDYFDSVLSLDLKTGAIKWGTHLRTYDIWTLACIRPAAPQSNCPVPSSPDSGSGSGPNVLGNIVGVGQKDGVYWALNADTGAPLWSKQVGPGGSAGGVQWGTATDGSRIYAAIANSDAKSYTLTPSGQNITWGAWSALDSRTGNILWQTADPISGSQDLASVSVANGVLYAASNSGHMYALDSSTGKVLWDFNSGGSVIDGPSIVDGTLFWGSGYTAIANNKVFAFAPIDGTTAQTISFATLSNQTYGKAPFALAANASSGLPITYSVMGPASISGSTLTITGVGTVTVLATQAGSSTYAEATPVTRSFTVNKAVLKATANNALRSAGFANPAFTYVLSGFVNGDTTAVVSGTVKETTTATTGSAPGTYPITFSTQSLAAANYSFTYVPGTLTVTSAQCQTINNYANGFAAAGLSLNNGAVVKGTLLQLTDGGASETRSVFYTTPVPISSFSTDFKFQLLNAVSDGFTFTVQSINATIYGGGGGGLGFTGMPNSAAIKFDLHSNQGEGNDSTGFYVDGAAPTIPFYNLVPSGVDLHSGHVLQAHIAYANGSIAVTITDTQTAASATATFNADLSTAVGSSAYIGFTAGAGGSSATQNILSWSFAGGSGCGQ